MLSNEELLRYKRQLSIDGWGEKAQEKLKTTKVFVAGAGGSGSPIITQLALLGVGCIRICDFDDVELSNLNRQFLHCVSEDSRIGVNKAVSAKKTVMNINPNVKVEIFTDKINDENIDEMVGDSTILFDSVDKIDVKFMLSKCAIRKKIPHLFYGMMDINAFMCIFYPPKTPCFHCLFDFDKVQEINSISNELQPNLKASTPVCCPPVLTSAGFAVTESLKILLDLAEPAYNKFFFFLQKSSEKGGTVSGYQGMRYWMAKYFYDMALSQGFDLDTLWRNNYVEEIELSPDSNCKHCAGLHKSKIDTNIVDVDFKF